MLASIPTLKSLDLYHTLVSDKGYQEIKSALPQVPDFLGQGLGADIEAQTVTRIVPRGIILLLFAGSGGASGNLDWVDGLGGKIERDAAGSVIAVHLRGTWVSDSELLDLARLPKLERLDLSHTRITDEGLLHLKPATADPGSESLLRRTDHRPGHQRRSTTGST